jgi:hypothetical protein
METTTLHPISSIQFKGDIMILQSAQQTYKWKVTDISKKLSMAPDTVRNNFIISPSGYGIHWPQIDEDLSINGLLNTK